MHPADHEQPLVCVALDATLDALRLPAVGSVCAACVRLGSYDICFLRSAPAPVVL